LGIGTGFVIEVVLLGYVKIADWGLEKRLNIALVRAAYVPLFQALLGLRQDRACVRISKPCPDHAQQDVGHGWGFCFLDLCRVFIYDGFFIIPKP
jgi:hypothetical protein